MSFVLPLVQLQVFANTMPELLIINLPEVVIGKVDASPSMGTIETAAQIMTKNSWQWMYLIYGGMLIAAILFSIKLFKLLYLIEKNPKRWHGDILLIKLLKSTAAFSFFNRVFIGDAIDETKRNTILQHEMVHVMHRHSIDLLFFEVLRIIMWFNPLIYLYQSRITALHEYIADAEVTKNQDKQVYYQNLLAQVFDTNKISFINPFYKQSLIKKRIVMLSKSKSKSAKLFKYLLLIPLILGMIIYSSCTQESVSQDQSNNNSLSEKIRILNDEIENSELTQEDVDAINRLFINTNIKYENYSYQRPENEIKEVVELISIEDLKAPINSEEVEIPYAIVERVPAFEGCETLPTNQQIKECTSQSISQFVSKNFDISIGEKAGLKGRQRVTVVFKINNNGEIVDVKSRAAHPDLEAEAKRVVESIPPLTPSQHKGENITVMYSLPIIFQISE